MELITNKYISGAMESLQGGRMENQDDLGYINTPLGFLVVVCDGMGGGPGGKLASHLAKSAIGEYIDQYSGNDDRQTIVRNSINRANDVIKKQVATNPSLRGMGTTVVVMLMDKTSIIVGHVGDSRFYKIRGRQIAFKTRDHSVVADMVHNKILTEEQARLSSQSNILTRSVGVSDDVEVQIDEIAYEKGDRLAICTDGLWGANSETELVKDLSAKNNIPVIVEQLMEKTDAKGIASGGQHDNLTLVLFETNCNSKLKEKMSKKTKRIIAALALLVLISIIGNIILIKKLPIISELEKHNKLLVDSIEKKDSTIVMYKSRMSDAQQLARVSEDASKANQKANDMLSKGLKDSLQSVKNRVAQLQKENAELKEKVNNAAKNNTNAAARIKNIKDAKTALGLMLKYLPITGSNRNNFNKQKGIASYAVKQLGNTKIAEQIIKLGDKTKQSDIKRIINQLPNK